MLCLLDGLYRELGPVDDALEPLVIGVSAGVSSELSLLAVLAPLMSADLRLVHSDALVATDASEEGLGGCCSCLPRAAL